MNTTSTAAPPLEPEALGTAAGAAGEPQEKPSNPYVGPRTFKTDEKKFFFGRDREAQDLLSVVITERLVLFYAQSGAGKSSLIYTCLLPGLNDEGEYRVLPVGRLLGETEVREDVDNIYIHHLITSLVKRRIDESILSKLTLSQFLARLDYDEEQKYFYNERLIPEQTEEESEPGWKFVLIIDQFEELFTTYQAEWSKREDFFHQLAGALEDFPNLSIVLVMRDDYVAVLEPYAYLLPGKLRGRYYMERLGHQAARKAVEGPAAKQNRPFVPEVAEKLVNDLSSIKVRTPDDQVVMQPGQYVEPVQLQVICSSLWDKLDPGATQITQDLVEEYVGDVNTALGNYFAKRVGEIVSDLNSRGKFVSEYEVRQWFETRLITSDSTRNLVAQVPGGRSGGLEDFIVQAFVQRGDLVRAEKRGGVTFYELTHDRLIEPIRQDNRAWFETNADLLQKRTAVWLQQGRNPSLLLRGRDLREAKRITKTRQPTEDERAFLDNASSTQRSLYTLWGLTAFTILALLSLTVFAMNQTAEAQRQKSFALSEATVSAHNATLSAGESLRADKNFGTAQANLSVANTQEALAKRNRDEANAQGSIARAQILQNAPGGLFKSTLLAMDAILRSKSLPSDPSQYSDAEEILRENLTFLPRRVDMDEIQQDGEIEHMVISTGGAILFTASWNNQTISGQLCGWRLRDRKNIFCRDISSPIHNMVFRDSQVIASNEQGQVIILIMSGGDTPKVVLRKVDFSDKDKIKSLEVGPDGRKILIIRTDGKINVNDIKKPNKAGYYLDSTISPTAIVFSPTGQRLAAGAVGGTVAFWGLSDGSFGSRKDHNGMVNVVRFTPDERYIISGGRDHYALVLDRMTGGVRRLPHTGSVNYLDVSPDGTWVATATEDRQIRVWDLKTGKDKVRILQDSPITGLIISPQGQLVITAGADKYIHAWNAETGQEVLQIPADTGSPVLAFDKEDNYLYVGDPQGKVSVWDISTLATPSRSLELEGMAENIQYLPEDKVALADGSWVWILPPDSFKGLTALPNNQPTFRAMSTLATISHMAVSPGLAYLAVTTEGNVLEVVDLANKRTMLFKLDNTVKDMAFSPDGRNLITLDTDGKVRTWPSFSNASSFKEITPRGQTISSISVGPELLAMGSAGKIWLADPDNPVESSFTAASGDHTLLAFSADGSRLADANSNGAINLWQSKDGSLSQPIQFQKPEALSLAFSQNGKRLAIGTARNVFLVDTSNGSEIARIPVSDIVNDISFSHDGRLLTVASSNLIQTWELESMQPIDDLLQAACQRVGRNLDEAQWRDVLSQENYDTIMKACGS